jgi:outer membrane protein assembly factor BamB
MRADRKQQRGRLAALVPRPALCFLAGIVICALSTPVNNSVAQSPVDRPTSSLTDWPMYRHDDALSAVSPIRGGFATRPEIAWSIDLGGPRVAAESLSLHDVIGDGGTEFITQTTDTVTCRDSRGQQLWQLHSFPNPVIVDVRDFSGDGTRGILMTTTRAGKVDTYMIAGRTGKATHLWLDENNFGGHTRIGRLVKDVAGAQIAATASGQTPPDEQSADIRLVGFENGLDHPHFLVKQHITGVIYSPIFLFADLAGDGRQDMVVVSHEQIWAFDVRTGRQSFYSAYVPSIRTYWATIAAVKLEPHDPRPALVMINPHLPGLKAVRQDGKANAQELWKKVIGTKEDQYQKQVSISAAGSALVYDLNNDGHFFALVSIENEHGDGQSHLGVFDTRNGERVAELPDAKVLAADDLDGDGKPEFLLLRGADLHIARWTSRDFQSIWHREGASPVLRQQPSEGDLAETSGNNPAVTGNSVLWREKPDSARFLLRFPDGVHSCQIGPGGLDVGRIVTEHEALGSQPAARPHSDRVVWNGAVLATSVDGKEVYRYTPKTQVSYLAPPPLAAELSGEKRILVRKADGAYLVCSTDGKPQYTILERSDAAPQILVDPASIGPVICDADGDGDNDVVATVSDARGRPACVVLDGTGREKRRFELLPGMTAMNRGPTGRLGQGRGRWILLRMSGEGPSHERREILVAIDGKTGQQLWVRDQYGRYGETPVVCRPHFPSTVVDFDGDGADDWLICSENFYGIISVKDNKDLVGPVVLSGALKGHWTAYSFPSLVSLGNDAKPVAFHHNAYSLLLVTDLFGKPLWHFGLTRDTGSAWGQIADLVGDGQREVIHAQPDGVLRCFTLEPAGRCPSCPADGTAVAEKTSAQRWQLDLGQPVSRMAAADLTGDGRMAVVFGGDDGNLHALVERDGKPELLWTVSFGRKVGEPIMTEIGGRPAILVATEDGQLHCLRPR